MQFKERIKKICTSDTLQHIIEGENIDRQVSVKTRMFLGWEFVTEIYDIVEKECDKNGYDCVANFVKDYPLLSIKVEDSFFHALFQIAVETIAFEILEESGELLNKPPIRLHQIHLANVELQ